MKQAEEDAAQVVQSIVKGKRARLKCVKKLAAYEEQQANPACIELCCYVPPVSAYHQPRLWLV